MSNSKNTCSYQNCNEEQSNTRHYRNCNKCYCPVGSTMWPFCDKHAGYTDETGKQCVPPQYWSCIECYPQDWYNWYGEEKKEELDKFLEELREYRAERRKIINKFTQDEDEINWKEMEKFLGELDKIWEKRSEFLELL